jgi:hypothetical protein
LGRLGSASTAPPLEPGILETQSIRTHGISRLRYFIAQRVFYLVLFVCFLQDYGSNPDPTTELHLSLYVVVLFCFVFF